MSLWDEIADLFKTKEQLDKEKQEEIKNAEKLEKDLFSKLDKLDKEYNNSLPKYEEKDYESMLQKYDKKYKEDTTLSDDNIDKIAKDSAYNNYDNDVKNIEKVFNDYLTKNENKRKETINKNSQNLYDLIKIFEKNNNQIDDSMSKKGLYNSSIKDNLKKENKDNYSSKVSSSNKLTKDILNELDLLKNNSEKEKEFELKTLEKQTDKKYNDLLSELLSKRNKERQKILEYNENVDNEKTKYNNNLTKLISELKIRDKKAYDEAQKLQAENEEKYGYSGSKKANYDERLKLATEFYNTLPKDIALAVAKNNPQLKGYLGNYYSDLLGKINSRPERTSIFS